MTFGGKVQFSGHLAREARSYETYRFASPVRLLIRVGLGVAAHEVEVVVPGDCDAVLGHDDGPYRDVDKSATGAEPWTLSNAGAGAMSKFTLQSGLNGDWGKTSDGMFGSGGRLGNGH